LLLGNGVDVSDEGSVKAGTEIELEDIWPAELVLFISRLKTRKNGKANLGLLGVLLGDVVAAEL